MTSETTMKLHDSESDRSHYMFLVNVMSVHESI